MKTFYHTGSLGDIIYSLPYVKAQGGGKYITGLPMPLHKAIKPLLEYQEYIDEVYHITETGLPPDVHNFDVWQLDTGHETIHVVKQYQGDYTWPWLKLPACRPCDYSVINVTPRVRDKAFNWRKEVKWLKQRSNEVYFIGYKDEYDAFVKQYGPIVKFYPTLNLLMAAMMLKHAKYFSCNQSCMLTIAQGLGRTYRLEQSPSHSNAITGLPNETIINKFTRKIHWFCANTKRYFRQP